MDNPVQLRIGFGDATPRMVLNVDLSGASVLAASPHATPGDVAAVLATVSIPVHVTVDGVRFPSQHLPRLRDLPAQVTVSPGPNVEGLWELLTHPSADNLPVKVVSEPDGSFWMSWYDGQQDRGASIPKAAASGLLAADVSFVAEGRAFDDLRAASALPVLAGRGRVNLDGFIEIFTSKPQLAESAPLPGLFRVDGTRLGMPLAFLDNFINAPGFSLEHPPPTAEAVKPVSSLPIPLSEHASSEVLHMAHSLVQTGARAVAWETGLGRRIFALAALSLIDAWPVLVVCPPDALWAWTRHARLLGKSWSLAKDRRETDMYITTYSDADPATARDHVRGLVFDQITGRVAQQHRGVCLSIGALTDAYRIGVSDSWPTNEHEVLDVMQLLRPAEFDVAMPVAARYPGQSRQRFTEHVSCYLSLRRKGVEVADNGFRHSGVVSLPLNREQREAIHALTVRTDVPPAVTLAETMEVISAGTARSLSPKVAQTVARVAQAAEQGKTCVVLSRHSRTLDLLSGLLRSYSPTVVEASGGPAALAGTGRVVLMRFDRDLPNLRQFDVVLCHDYPWSVAVLDTAVGPPSGSDGPEDVTILHAAESVDDRLAVFSVERGESHLVNPETQFPTGREVSWLLGTA